MVGACLSLGRHLGQLNAEGVGHSFPVCRGGLQAVADVANLDLLRRIAEGPGGILEQNLLLLRAHQPEQFPRL